MVLAILLPGLDGTGDLFAPFASAAPASFSVHPWRLPSDEPLSYPELADWAIARLPQEPLMLIAESFSGPLGVLVAERCANVRALVLCASFVLPPGPRLFAHLPQLIWSRPPPVAAISFFMTGGDRALAATLQRAMLSVSTAVMAARMAAVLTVDVRAELQRVACPTLYLQATADRLVSARSGARVCKAKPSVEVARIEGPHLLLQARARQAWEKIVMFVEGASGLQNRDCS